MMVNLIEIEKNITLSGWEVVTIGDIFKFSSGKSRPKKTSKEKTADFNIPVYGGNGILGYSNQIFLNHPTLILGRVGEYCGCAHLTETKSWISDNALYVKECIHEVDLIFMKNCFEYMNLNQYSNKMGQPLITQGIIKKIKFGLPPLPEQRKIAHVLSTVQKAIEQQDKLIHTTTELKKALMQKLFTEGTKGESQKETEIGLVPESWEVVKIEKYILKTKNRDPRKEPEKDFIYVDVSSVSNEFFRIENTLKICGKEAPSRARKIIQDGDVIFATVRPTLKRIAKISQDYHNQICSTGYCVLKPDQNELSQEYLYQYLQTDFIVERIEKLQRGASYPAVRDTDVKSIYIPLPKLSEQKEIEKTLNILYQKNNVLINKKQTLATLFKTLLHELMTGQRRVHELEFEKMEDFQ